VTTQPIPPAPAGGMSRFNRFMVRFLTSPFGSVSGRVVLIRYVGRASGQQRQLPVNVETLGDDYLIRVGRPEQKNWWRNFRSSWPIELVRGRRIVRGSAVAVPGTTERGRRIAEDYFTSHHGAAKRAGLPKLWKGERAAPEALAAAAAGLIFVVVTPVR
jgi:hypothetical protein